MIQTDKPGKWEYQSVPAATEQTREADFSLPADAMLRQGDRNDDVRSLQRALRSAGYALEVDGLLGRITLECVKSFQATHGLVRDGIVGPKTWAALQTVSADTNE